MIFYPLMLLGSVIFLDMCLSGDNALVVAMAANGVKPEYRDRAIFAGMGLAACLRAGLALVASTLLQWHIIGFIGGIALLWVANRLVKSLIGTEPERVAPKTLGSAMLTIVVADVSMSLDNVLAVASISRHHPFVMVLGILASIFILAFAARKVADLLQTYKWLNWVGVLLIVWVAIDLISGSYHATLAVIRN